MLAPPPPASGGLRLAELLTTVSLASDLAHDVPAESALRDALLAVQLARLAGWSEQDLSDVYYLALLYHVGCTGAVDAQSRMGGGDDVLARHWLSEADLSDRPQLVRITVSKLARQWGPADWARGLAAFVSAGRTIQESFAGIAEVAVRLAKRLGASPQVAAALYHAYARWDGRVFVDLPSREALSPIARMVHLVHVAQTYHRVGGVDAADAVVRQRSGSEFDPQLAALWLECSRTVLPAIEGSSVWEEALSLEPEPHRRVAPAHLDEVVRALADYVDLKSVYTYGHSPAVAHLASSAGEAAGLTEGDLRALRLAGHLHDLGNVGVPHLVWVKSGSLSPSEWTRVRQHTFQGQRILGVGEPLRACRDLVGLHHERLDGSGYHRGLPAAALPLASRILAAAEAYRSMIEERAWRPAMTPAEAASNLRRDAGAGLLDRRCVDAVLTAAGHASARGRAGRSWPSGLTDREIDVLRCLAGGSTNRQMARELNISEATVHTHVINIYGKLGISTRAGATLYAMENDLLAAPPLARTG
ncbi:MAG: HD domain-containing phosphohydrolase [Candidatus Dormibacteria bacterium]